MVSSEEGEVVWKKVRWCVSEVLFEAGDRVMVREGRRWYAGKVICAHGDGFYNVAYFVRRGGHEIFRVEMVSGKDLRKCVV